MKKSFAVTWLSQTLVIFSVVLVVFSAGIVIYNETGSLTSFGLIVLCGYVPELLIIPLAGSLVDRVSRKTVLIACSLLQAVVFSFYFLILMQDASIFKSTYFVIATVSAIAGVHRLAYNSSIALFSNDPQIYPRLNGVVQSGLASAHILAPLVAGLLLEYAASWTIAATAVTACTASAVALTTIHFPELQLKTATTLKNGWSLGVRHIKKSKGLREFLAIHAFANFARGAALVLFTPLILTFSSEAILGSLRSTAGAGLAVGSLLITSWGGPVKQVTGVLYALLICGIAIALIGVSQNLVLIGVAAFTLCVGTPILASLAHSIWQHQVPVDTQGRVFAVRDTVAGAALAAGYVVSPLVTDWVFIPLSESPGKGLSSTYLATGLLTITLAIVAARKPVLRALER